MEIIKHSEVYDVVEFRREFVKNGEVHYSFDCDRHGEPSSLSEVAQKSWTLCTTTGEYSDMGVRRYENTVRECAEGKCDCGRIVYLSDFTNPCECGRDYNMSGQQLAPRSFWGEETGEHWTECV